MARKRGWRDRNHLKRRTASEVTQGQTERDFRDVSVSLCVSHTHTVSVSLCLSVSHTHTVSLSLCVMVWIYSLK